MQNINNLVKQICNGIDIISIVEKVKENTDYIELNYMGNVTAQNLKELVNLSKNNQEFIPLLCQVIMCSVDSNSVDNNTFETLMNFPGKLSKTLMWSLAHCNLPFYQMWKLNSKYGKDFPELRCNLISAIYKNECFTEEDVIYFFDNNRDFNKEIFDIDSLIKSVPKNSKTKMLKQIFLI